MALRRQRHPEGGLRAVSPVLLVSRLILSVYPLEVLPFLPASLCACARASLLACLVTCWLARSPAFFLSVVPSSFSIFDLYPGRYVSFSPSSVALALPACNMLPRVQSARAVVELNWLSPPHRAAYPMHALGRFPLACAT